MRAVGAQLRKQADDLAALMTAEMGKPHRRGPGRGREVRDRVRLLRRARPGVARRPRRWTPARSAAGWRYEPLGVVLAVMPWNFPFWQVLRFAARRPAGRQRGDAQALPQRDRLRAGHRAGVRRRRPARRRLPQLVVAEADVPAVSRRIVEDARVAAVTLTGSERAARPSPPPPGGPSRRACWSSAGPTRSWCSTTPTSTLAVAGAVAGRFINTRAELPRPPSASSCTEPWPTSSSRRFAEAVAELRVGDPRDAATTIGPLARADLRDGLDRQVPASVGRRRRRS